MTKDTNNLNSIRRNASQFFRNIGLKRLTNKEFDRFLESHGGQDLLRELNVAYAKIHEDRLAVLTVMHSDLQLARQAVAQDFERLCNAAGMLSTVELPPNPRILDLGGDIGQLAFWMARHWPSCSVTVVDPVGANLGRQWAAEIGIDNVDFVEGTYHDLQDFNEGEFDLIVLSAVLTSTLGEEFPTQVTGLSRNDFLASSTVRSIINDLTEASLVMSRILKRQGIIAWIECWSDARLLIVGHAFDAASFTIDWNQSALEQQDEHAKVIWSLLVLSQSADPIPDATLSAITYTRMSRKPLRFVGGAAESIRDVFADVEPLWLFEAEYIESGEVLRIEILQREGLLLYYKTTEQGHREAEMASTAGLPGLMRVVKQYEDMIDAGKATLIQKRP